METTGDVEIADRIRANVQDTGSTRNGVNNDRFRMGNAVSSGQMGAPSEYSIAQDWYCAWRK